MSVSVYTPVGSGSTLLGDVNPSSSALFSLNSSTTKLAVSIVLPETKTLSAIEFELVSSSGGNYGYANFHVETNDPSSTGNKPSGLYAPGATGATGMVFSSNLGPHKFEFGEGYRPTLSAYTRYWLVIDSSLNNGTNFPRFYLYSYPDSYYRYCNNLYGYISTTTGTFTASSTLTYASSGFVFHFTDGSVLGLAQERGASLYSVTSYKIYGTTNVMRLNSKVYVPTLVDGFVAAIRQGSSGKYGMTFTLKDDAGTTLETISADVSLLVNSTGGERICFFQFPSPRWLDPFREYYIYCEAPSNSTSTNFMGILILQESPLTGVSAMQGLNGVGTWTASISTTGATGVYSAIGGEDVHPRAAWSVLSFGNFSGYGLIEMDSSIRDGSSGYSVKLRAGSEITEYHFIRRFVAQSSKTGYSVKMRRDSSYIPATHSVKLYKNGSQIGTTLSADTNANNTFYTYSLSGLSISANDVIEIHYITKLSANAGATEDYAWFDTEAFS